MNALSRITVELSSRCNKECGMCGRTPMRIAGTLDQGDMIPEMAYYIAEQIPKGTVVQFHWNGEPTLNPRLGTILGYFKHCITGMNTNGKLLLEKATEIIGMIDTLTLSVIQDDPEAEEQWDTLQKFLLLKGDAKPMMIYRLLGDVDPKRFENLGQGIIATRILHAAEMSRDYEKPVTIPEMGICLDMLHTVAISYKGQVNHCVRFDPKGKAKIGKLSITTERASLQEIVMGINNQAWHHHPRQSYIRKHRDGDRHKVPLCSGCDFYGVPTGRFDFYGKKQAASKETSDHERRFLIAEDKQFSRIGQEMEKGAETQEKSEVSLNEGQTSTQSELDLKCKYCSDQGVFFEAKSNAGLSAHIRQKHKRGIHKKGLVLDDD